MSVSFYLYIADSTNNNSGWTFPDNVRERMCDEIVPDHSSSEFTKWFDGEYHKPNPLYDRRLDLNISQRNAQLLLNELGFIGEDLDVDNSPPIPVAVFEAGLLATIARVEAVEPGIPTVLINEENQPRIMHFGVADGYVNTKLERLKQLVEAAKEYGQPISVGVNLNYLKGGDYGC